MHFAIQLIVDVGESREVTLADDCGRETRLREYHDAGRRLYEMSAGARADDEKESVLDLAMQPHDAGQAAKYLALTALTDDRRPFRL